MSKQKHFTLVFQVTDDNEFREFLKQFDGRMFSEEPVQGAIITGAGWDDSMSRADKLVELCESNDIDIPRELY